MLRAAPAVTSEQEARRYEQSAVHDVYETIAEHFSDTRYKVRGRTRLVGAP
jgi:hypothetical protein